MRTISGINKFLALVVLLVGSFSFVQLVSAHTKSEGDLLADLSSIENVEGEFQGRHHRRGDRMRSFMAEKLGLTDEQKAQIKQIKQSHHDSVKPLVQELRTKKQELRQAFEGNVYNESLATQKLTEMAGLKAKLMGEKFKMHNDITAVFTPEQKAKLAEMKEQFKNKRGERKQFRHPRHSDKTIN